MNSQAVDTLHHDLNYSSDDLTVLRAIRGVWTKLEKLKALANKDPRMVGAYREALQASLTQARKQQVGSDESQIARGKAFWDWYLQEYVRLGIADKEHRRGRDHTEWCAKFLPKEHALWVHTFNRVVELPCEARYDEAKSAATALFKAYVGVFEDS